MDVYGSHLQNIADILQRAGFAPSIRGEDTARFVYAKNAERGVEAYWDGEGFTVELFEHPHEVAVREDQHGTSTVAAERAVEWLSRRESA